MARVGTTRLGLGSPLAKSIDYDAFDTKGASGPPTPTFFAAAKNPVIGKRSDTLGGDATRSYIN